MIKLSNKQLVEMLDLQAQLNTRIDPNWIAANYPWHRAAWVECGELVEHIGWKWWKNQEPDIVQAQLEVMDIWHFALSYAIQSEGPDIYVVASKIRDDEALAAGPLATGYAMQAKHQGERAALLGIVELLVQQCVESGAVSPAVTLHLAEKLGLTADAMYRQYVGKNVLNIFRQDHGYKEGAYRKVWRGLEDNKVVAEWMKAEPDWTPQQLMEELGRSYGTP